MYNRKSSSKKTKHIHNYSSRFKNRISGGVYQTLNEFDPSEDSLPQISVN